jgi:hypothetical protein
MVSSITVDKNSILFDNLLSRLNVTMIRFKIYLLLNKRLIKLQNG